MLSDLIKLELFLQAGISAGEKLHAPENSHYRMLSILNDELKKLLAEIESDPAYDPASRRKIRKTIAGLAQALIIYAGELPVPFRNLHRIPTLEEHYNRNQNMPVDTLPQTPAQAVEWGWNDNVASDCHQFTSPDRSNIKFVSPDGKSEVIFDKYGNMVTASEDYGTYNFANSAVDPIGHFYEDVLPWIIWGNDEKDSTDIRQRLRAFIIYGGADTVANEMKKIGQLRQSRKTGQLSGSEP